MATSKNETQTGQAEIQLSRSLGLFSVTMMGVGGMIGAGIFALCGIAAGEAGPAVVLVFIFNGFITLLTALAYAELGSAFPRAGGGYVWVKEGLGGANGFLAGWMSWFGYLVAGALYAIAFSHFAFDGWVAAGLPTGGLPADTLRKVFIVAAIVVFTGLNVLGSEETGATGAVITMVKIAILAIFIVIGAVAMLAAGDWQPRFVENFLPNGAAGVLIGMGLTFIAFEGYEIIAQSGEEIIKPARNVPRGIFFSIAIAVAIYVLVGMVAVGAVHPPEGVPAYQFLGAERELAIVSVARQIIPWGIGGALMLVSGIAATISALNVTVFSASRVSFAMGRDHNLPPVFASVHPRWLTPFVAILVTGLLMLAAAMLLPIETAATAGGVMFLLMFIQVNVAVISLRRTHADVSHGFLIPFFPIPALLAVAANAALVLYTLSFNPVAVWSAFGWIVAGLLAYYIYFERKEALEAPREIVYEEAVGKHDYTVLVAIRDDHEAATMGWFASLIARARGGGLLATHMLELPRSLSLGEGRRLVQAGHGYFDTIREMANRHDVETHSLIMIARRVAHAIEGIVAERAVDFLVLGWSGETKRGRRFGRTNDPLLANPPADMAIVRPAARRKRTVENILVPVDESANSRLAVELATDLGRHIAGRANAAITLLRVVPTKTAANEGAPDLFDRLLEGITYGKIETRVVVGRSEAKRIVGAAEDFDLVIFGASEASPVSGLFPDAGRGGFSSWTMKRVLSMAKPTTVVVKRHPALLRSFIQRIMPLR